MGEIVTRPAPARTNVLLPACRGPVTTTTRTDSIGWWKGAAGREGEDLRRSSNLNVLRVSWIIHDQSVANPRRCGPAAQAPYESA
jgi:hypothetical protein